MQISAKGVSSGLDVGCGNLKAVAGVPGSRDTHKIALPAGAAPLRAMPRRSDSSADLKGGGGGVMASVAW